MPSLEVENYGVAGVATVDSLLSELLLKADTLKPTASIDPALEKADFEDLPARLARALAPAEEAEELDDNGDSNKARRFAIIETAARDKFSKLIATTSIESPDFIRVWNLFDILSILSDCGSCEPALLFWLVEELLDSQTIAGCRIVFDFLESRREKITSKHFEQKKLVILRTCNELLRRLSRAEDTAFCGRVFIFMFQSFPLGDKSSVNLRGEYHVENETTFDHDIGGKDESGDKVDVDTQNNGLKPSSADGTGSQPTKPLSSDELYPIFWSLQSSFSQPKKLFDAAHLAQFKSGLGATMARFSTIKPETPNKTKQDEDPRTNPKSSPRETAEDGDDELANTFNPKYLTSRDLFELEISDLAFRRSILAQALITLDFLLSLSPKAKEKLNTAKSLNKSVMYSDQVLSEDDSKWAIDMKKTISEYLRQFPTLEGPYFVRVMESALTRDKNWVRWKVENCPSIEMPRVSPQQFNEAKAVARKMATNKRPYSGMGSLSLDFLAEDSDGDVMKKFRSKERCEAPKLMIFRGKIADDDFEIERSTDIQSRAAAIESKASKSWRALRVASKYKLAAFDKIDNPDKIDAIFEEDAPEEPEDYQQIPDEAPKSGADRRPLIIVGPSGIGKSSLVQMLLEKNEGIFEKVAPHITREPGPGERNGEGYHFVDAQTFSMMRDGDQFIQYTDTEGVNTATSRKLVDAVIESGKIPVLVMDHDGAQQVKDLEYAARFVFVKPSTAEILETRLKNNKTSSEQTMEIMKNLPDNIKRAESVDFYDRVIVGDNLESAYDSICGLVFGVAENAELLNGDGANGEKEVGVDGAGRDEPMEDVNESVEAKQMNGTRE